MEWDNITAVIGIVLGSQAVAELVRWIKNRKTDRRIEEARASNDEFSNLRETIQFLQEQLQQKETRFADQTLLTRKLNTEVIDLTKSKAEVELEFARFRAASELMLERVRCEDKPCPWRQPPNAHTEPKPEISKEEYHTKKRKNGNT